MNTFFHMHWLLTSPVGFDLYTDHNSLVFLSAPWP